MSACLRKPANRTCVAAALVLVAASVGRAQGNVLLVVADDVGIDSLPVYGLGSDLPTTPFIDSLAAGGMRFDNVWSNPLCSPTRATIQTGRHCFRNGIGYLVVPGAQPLLLEELTIPELLDFALTGYAHASFGKWHLGGALVGGALAPNLAGYSHYAGSLGNLNDYYNYPKVVDGVVSTGTTYVTTDTVNDAVAWLASAPEPWFCHVSFHAAHNPVHAPPPHLHSVDLTSAGPPSSDPRPYFKAMIEAMDREMLRLFVEAGLDLTNTTVIFVGDNGTGAGVTVAPFDPTHSKFTVYQGGIHVPMIVAGPGLARPGSTHDALIHTADIFATVAELTGASDYLPAKFPKQPKRQKPFGSHKTLSFGLPAGPLDSVSFAPYLGDPALPSIRTHVYSERFFPNGTGAPTSFARAIRNHEFKLIVHHGSPGPPDMYLYNLKDDFFEQQNLLELPLGVDEMLALAELQQELLELLLD